MYLVSPDYLKTTTSSGTRLTPPPPPKMARKASEAGKKHGGRRRRSVKNAKTKKDTARHEYNKWVKVRAKLHEADVERKRQITTVVDFLKQILPSSPNLGASHLGTQTTRSRDLREMLHKIRTSCNPSETSYST
jgi:hypothetical protein